jgi:hypothetical protein
MVARFFRSEKGLIIFHVDSKQCIIESNANGTRDINRHP